MTTKKKQQSSSLFVSAQAAISGGTADECTELIAQLDQLIRDEASEANQIRPPGKTLATGPQGGTYEVPTRPGPEFQAAALDENVKQVEALRDRFTILQARLQEARKLLTGLKERRSAAQEEERRAAAPKVAKRLVAEADAVLDRVEAARAELQEALTARTRLVTDLKEARKLAGPDSPALKPEQLWRLHASPDGEVWWRRRGQYGDFEFNGYLLDNVRTLLAPVDPSVFARLRSWAGRVTSTIWHDRADPASDVLQEDIDRTRAKLISEQRFKDLADPEQVQREAILDREPEHRRQRISEEVDTWLTPSKAKL
jgi:hypothetical protein